MQRALLQRAGEVWKGAATAQRVGARYATKSDRDAFDVRSGVSAPTGSVDRPLSRDSGVRKTAAQQPAGPGGPLGVLHDSLSDGLYFYPYTRRSSVADPEYFLGNSMSDAFYEVPSTLRASSLNARRPKVS